MLARRERRQLRYAVASTAVRGTGLQVLCCSRAAFVVGSRGPPPCSLDKSVASFVTLSLQPLSAVQGCTCFAAAAAFVLGSGGPSPCSLEASVASIFTLAFPPLRAVPTVPTRCRAASALLQPLSSFLALGRCHARFRRVSPASHTLAFLPLSAVHGCNGLLQRLPSSSALVGRRRARSTRASPASLRCRSHRCARHRAASALL